MKPWGRCTWEGDDDAVRVSTFLGELGARLPKRYGAYGQLYLVLDPQRRTLYDDDDGNMIDPDLVWPIAEHGIGEPRARKLKAAGYYVMHPDITIIDHASRRRTWPHDIGYPRVVIELDGSIHDTRPGRRKTERRNRKYKDAMQPYVAVNEADCRFIKREPFDFAWPSIARYLVDENHEPLIDQVKSLCRQHNLKKAAREGRRE